MHTFIKKTLLFLFTLSCSYLAIYIGTLFVVNKQTNFRLEHPKKYIIIGHSHSECAINENHLPEFENLAQSGESYFYSQIKLKRILAHNPEIKEVWIEFSNNQIIPKMEDWMYGDMYLIHRIPIYAPFMSLEDHLFLLSKNFWGYWKVTALVIQKNIERIYKNEDQIVKEIKANPRNNKVYIERKAKKIEILKINCKQQKITFDISVNHLRYLQKTIQIAENHEKVVRIIRSPIHASSTLRCIEKTYQQQRKNWFHDLPFSDFIDFKLEDDEWMDYQHLNEKGAERFSITLQKRMEEMEGIGEHKASKKEQP
jgi:hypothetical protein